MCFNELVCPTLSSSSGSIFFFLIFALSACGTAIEYYYVSLPSILNGEVYINEGGELSLNFADIIVRPTNNYLVGSGVGGFYSDTKLEIKPSRVLALADNIVSNKFVVEIYIKPKVATFKIDLSKVVYVDNNKLNPSSYKFYTYEENSYNNYIKSSHNYMYSLCHKSIRKKLVMTRPVSGLVSLADNDEFCVSLIFDAPVPSPSENFNIKIEGLNVNGSSVYIPAIYYSGKSLRRPTT